MSMKDLGYTNPIVKILSDEAVKEQYGSDFQKRLINWSLAKAPLNPDTDTPLPDWAVDLLLLGRLSYRARLRIMFLHAEEILRRQRNENRNLWKESDDEMRKWKREMAEENRRKRDACKQA